MSKRYLGAIALGAGLTFVPVTVGTSDETTARLAVSEACAMEGECCSLSMGDLCLIGDEILANYRTGGGQCVKPGT